MRGDDCCDVVVETPPTLYDPAQEKDKKPEEEEEQEEEQNDGDDDDDDDDDNGGDGGESQDVFACIVRINFIGRVSRPAKIGASKPRVARRELELRFRNVRRPPSKSGRRMEMFSDLLATANSASPMEN